MRVTQRRRMRTWPLWSPHQQKPRAEPSSRSQPVGVHADIEACACSVAPQVGSPNPLRAKRPQNALKWAPDSDPPSGASASQDPMSLGTKQNTPHGVGTVVHD